jgi:hypothetical protein
VEKTGGEYQVLVERCKQTLHQVEPLREVKPGVSGWSLMKTCGQNPQPEG